MPVENDPISAKRRAAVEAWLVTQWVPDHLPIPDALEFAMVRIAGNYERGKRAYLTLCLPGVIPDSVSEFDRAVKAAIAEAEEEMGRG